MPVHKENILAKVISVLTHPLLMPSYALLILFTTNTHFSYMPFEGKKVIFVMVFLCTFLIPVSIIPFLVNMRIVSGIGLKNHRERLIPLFMSAVSYYLAYYLLNRLPISSITFLKIMILASALLIGLCFFISMKWKISAHLIGIGGLLAGMFFYAAYYIANYTTVLVLLSLFAGATAYSRLKLQAHTPSQIYSGFLLGFFGMLITLYFGMN